MKNIPKQPDFPPCQISRCVESIQFFGDPGKRFRTTFCVKLGKYGVFDHHRGACFRHFEHEWAALRSAMRHNMAFNKLRYTIPEPK